MKTGERHAVLPKMVPHGSMGFTLLEILVALVLGILLTTAVCMLIIDQAKTHEDHQMNVMMQQNGRAAMAVMANELMLAGYRPSKDEYGTVTHATIDKVGVMYCDDNGGRQLIEYSYVDSEDRIGACRDNGTRRITLLRDVAAFRMLFAYDAEDIGSGDNGYGVLETAPGETRIAWAYSSQGDGVLDRYFTLNDDGTVQGNGKNPQPLGSNSVALDRIRAVKIWLLMQSSKRKNKSMAEADFGVLPGGDVKGLDKSKYSYRLFTTTVKLRNMYY